MLFSEDYSLDRINPQVLPNCEMYCPMGKLVQLFEKYVTQDWEKECNLWYIFSHYFVVLWFVLLFIMLKNCTDNSFFCHCYYVLVIQYFSYVPWNYFFPVLKRIIDLAMVLLNSTSNCMQKWGKNKKKFDHFWFFSLT